MASEPTGARAPFHVPTGRDLIPGFSGRLRHIAHGGPCVAVVGIAAPSARSCDILFAQLPTIDGVDYRRVENEGRHGLSVALECEQLDAFKTWIEPLRTDDPCTLFDCHPRHRAPWKCAKRHDIDGYEHSIDYGPLFELSVPYVDLLTPPLPGFDLRRADA